MSKAYQLPHDLKNVELRLASLRPTPSGVDRDQLMYRAGWEAALAHAERAVDAQHTPSLARMSRRAHWMRLLVPAAAAAALVVVGTWFYGPHRAEEPLADPKAPASGTMQAGAVESKHAARNDSLIASPSRVRQPHRFSFVNAPLLAMRERALRGDDQVAPVALESATSGSVDPPPSVWQLRDEILRQPRRPNVKSDHRLLHWLGTYIG